MLLNAHGPLGETLTGKSRILEIRSRTESGFPQKSQVLRTCDRVSSCFHIGHRSRLVADKSENLRQFSGNVRSGLSDDKEEDQREDQANEGQPPAALLKAGFAS